jgi:hypothetical protein
VAADVMMAFAAAALLFLCSVCHSSIMAEAAPPTGEFAPSSSYLHALFYLLSMVNLAVDYCMYDSV